MSEYEITPEEVFEQIHTAATPEAIDPRRLLEQIPVEFEDVEEGDFIGSVSWRRPRRVELVEHRDGERVLFLAEPDEARWNAQEGVREINLASWQQRGWVSYPNLRTIWDAALQPSG